MNIRLFNTLGRRPESPGSPEELGRPVTLYTCGPTVYNYLHVGNYRTYVFEDVLKRTLKLLGYEVRHVMNITDVGHLTSDADEGEDKLEVGAQREGKTAREIADFYEKTFLEDIEKLNIDFKAAPDPERAYRPEAADILCRATDHIEEQKRIVDLLIGKGVTYETSDGIYFDTSKFEGYGRLIGGAHLSGIKEGARVVSNPEKRNATDFALWKFSPKDKKRQMEWEYRGRMGFPGWHIECSAMAQTYLGDTFDIHCGGVDHIPVHHTNEIAQAEAATGKPFVRMWLHGEFLVMSKAKMAKSAGGFITLADLIEKGFDPLDYRYFCCGAHYRKQLEFSWESLEAARTARLRLRETALELLRAEGRGSLAAGGSAGEHVARFRERLADDLNVPKALAAFHDGLAAMAADPAGKLALIRATEDVLALGLTASREDELPADLQRVFDDYVAARKRKDYAASDRLRKELAEKGIRVKDSREGSVWMRA